MEFKRTRSLRWKTRVLLIWTKLQEISWFQLKSSVLPLSPTGGGDLLVSLEIKRSPPLADRGVLRSLGVYIFGSC